MSSVIAWEEEMRSGFCLEIENIGLLTQEQCHTLHKELSVLAVSTTTLFDDPIKVVGQRMTAHYSYEYHAQETRKHVGQYLQQIGMESRVRVTLQPAQWEPMHQWDLPRHLSPEEHLSSRFGTNGWQTIPLDGGDVSTMAHDIMVIGTSAGGVEALMTLVAGFPVGLRASLFIVLHMLPTHPSVLPKILSRSGPLPACHATEGMLIEQGTIYVAPPNHHLLLSRESLHLGTGPKEHHVRPAADVLFRSAARVYGPRVVGVVLTGNDGDGTLGLHAVKQSGGVTIVQDPDDAAWPEMPQHALERMKIDYTTPLLSIASLLIRLAQPSGDNATE